MVSDGECCEERMFVKLFVICDIAWFDIIFNDMAGPVLPQELGIRVAKAPRNAVIQGFAPLSRGHDRKCPDEIGASRETQAY